ncbi:MAG: hypothetical protein AAF512_17085 [Pseudomonadota bacterium]
MSDLLELLAQLAITIAALSAVAGANRSSIAPDEQNYLLRDVALIGLAIALYSFLPLLMFEAHIQAEIALPIAAGLATLSWFIGYLLYLRRIWGDQAQFTGMFYLGAVLTIAGLLFFASNLYVVQSVTYLSGLVCWLAIASLNFISGVFIIRREPGAGN